MKTNIFLSATFIAMVFTFFACSSDGDGGTVSHGDQTYKTVQIGTQTWMAENLNYKVDGGVCYDNDSSNCTKYGRLYDWATAMTVCPSGWHLPTNEEWEILIDYAGGSSIAARYLKATSGWDHNGISWNGEDKYGFAALPGGIGNSDGGFYYVGYFGIWWSASESDASNAYSRFIVHYLEYASDNNISKSGLFSVRCLQN